MTWKERQRRGRRFWTELPLHASVLFFLSVFFLFASIGFIGNPGSFSQAVPSALISGSIATVCGYLGTRGRYLWIIAFILLVTIGLPLAERYWQGTPTTSQRAAAAAAGPAAVTWAAIAAVVGGYMLMLYFIGTEGRRFYRLNTELELASAIHKVLAPAVTARLGGFEFAGASRPSGQMGGDLLDVVAAPGGWLAYVADVSGHGVAAGVLMGLVKSAARTWLGAHRDSQDGLLPDLNRTLAELLPPETFVTFAALSPTAPGQLRLAAAGHPPLLHYHAAGGRVSQLQLENFPLGLFPAAEFSSATVTCELGDVLALYTDGIAEVFNAQGAEFGDQSLETALSSNAALPLPEAADAVTAAARAFGAQTDDQTLLLVRRMT